MARIVELAKAYGRYGYRRITALLRREGWQVNAKWVERIWRQEGLKVPKKRLSGSIESSRRRPAATARQASDPERLTMLSGRSSDGFCSLTKRRNSDE